MWIKGFIHSSPDEAVLGNVHIVSNINLYAGEYVGYMELTNGEVVHVKKHPAGGYNGQIFKEA